MAVLANPRFSGAPKAQDPIFCPPGQAYRALFKMGPTCKGDLQKFAVFRTASFVVCFLFACFSQSKIANDADSKRLDACARRYVSRPSYLLKPRGRWADFGHLPVETTA